MATEKQIEANQLNAQKSTGPRTAEGKANSRRNALKHGLTSDKELLPAEDEKLYNERLERWLNDVNPATDIERYQIESAVLASVRLDRCKRHERAEMKRLRRRAIGRWEGAQTRRINAITKYWEGHPGYCVGELEKFTRGCDCLLDQWEELAIALEAKEFWTGEEAAMALRLLGKSPELLHEDDLEVLAFRRFALAAQDELDPDELDAFFGVDTSQLPEDQRLAEFEAKLPNRDDAREALWELVGNALDRLAPIRAKLWEQTDGPALSEKIDLATLDDTPLGQLRRRYETASQLDMHRCLNQLAKQERGDAFRREEDREKAKEARRRERRRLEENAERIDRIARGSSRNEPKSSAVTGWRTILSGQSPGAGTSPDPAPAKAQVRTLRAKTSPEAGAQTSTPPRSEADQVQKPS